MSQNDEHKAGIAPGKVYLVGAGPGDPGLLTLRGAELLGRADVVVHDHLAAPALLDLAPASARRIYVGKIGPKHALKQEEINSLLVQEALAGHTVVRLKGGDPYIFGRGGEEALELKKAGLKFEVVPGVTSAVAAAAAAGIPLTHRDMSSQAVIMTGREKPGKERSDHDWAALAAMGTLSAVMGAENLPQIVQNLLSAGKDPATPAALVQWGTTPRQRTVAGPLKDIAALAKRDAVGAPALLVVGRTVNLRPSLNWFEDRPLWGRTVLVTRTREQAGELSRALRELGADVIEKPAIKIEKINPNPRLLRAFDELSDYKHLILTSPNGASIFMEALLESGRDGRALAGLNIAVLGPGTAKALAAFGLKADLTPEEFIAEGLIKSFQELPRGRCLLARAEEGRDVLPKSLSDLGFEIDLIPIYRTMTPVWPDVEFSFSRNSESSESSETSEASKSSAAGNRRPDLATLTSASTAKGLAAHVPPAERSSLPVASIGPITTKAAEEAGFAVVAEAKTATIAALTEAVINYFTSGDGRSS
ncbi:MAG: uroporphyrinogen-III C-methyltransferase [Deltaproteobacteria bacterium]|jgi:uroporphyrinogen III methyltransferase/synthase|nr:uroporphyrinogen-III C-methyltransferase [Deltaproteobacteria bacterium]